MTTESQETVKVLWAGGVVTARVLRRFKNGKVRVSIQRAGVPGRTAYAATVEDVFTAEPWQIVKAS